MALTKTEIKYLIGLNNKRNRKQEKRFLCDGIRLLEESLHSRYLPLSVLYSPADITPRGQKLVDGFIAKKVSAKTISSKECHRITDTKTSQGVVALFAIRNHNLEKQLSHEHRRILVCDSIGDPGNLGTLMRSALAFGFSFVIATKGSAEMTNPKTVRSSMGAFFRLPYVENMEAQEVVQLLKKHGYTLYNADVKGKYISSGKRMEKMKALVIGAETAGTNPVFTTNADFRVKIPMAKEVESLNAAMAGTVLMYWMESNERAKK